MSLERHTRVLILGSGPAGCTAAIYAARANLKPIMIHGGQPGGQLTITTDVENYPGFATAIQGPWLMEQMQAQAEHVGTEIIYDSVMEVDLSARPFKLTSESGVKFTCDSLIIATGATARWLGIPSEEKFKGFGVSACATCDGFFFKEREVVVVGGGNSAVEEALFLSNFASKITVVHRRDSFRAERILQDKLFNNPKISVIWNAVVEEIIGTESPLVVTNVLLRDTKTGSVNTHKTDGVFVAIGHTPNTGIFKGQLHLDNDDYIITTPGRTTTNIPGVFAAGDVQDKIYRQAVTAAGTGCMAALEADKFLHGI